MRVIGYARCSTDEQADAGVWLEAQRQAIKREARRQGWQLVGIFEDVASGARKQRAGLEAAIEAVASGEADGLLVTKLDRLSRSVSHFATLLERFQKAGWGLVVMDLGVDTSTLMGAAMAHMVSVFAELERRRIGERTREALAVKKAQGVKLGRPRELPLAVRRRIARDRERGKSYPAIAAALNADGVPTAHGGKRWHPSTVRAVALSN